MTTSPSSVSCSLGSAQLLSKLAFDCPARANLSSRAPHRAARTANRSCPTRAALNYAGFSMHAQLLVPAGDRLAKIWSTTKLWRLTTRKASNAKFKVRGRANRQQPDPGRGRAADRQPHGPPQSRARAWPCTCAGHPCALRDDLGLKPRHRSTNASCSGAPRPPCCAGCCVILVESTNRASFLLRLAAKVTRDRNNAVPGFALEAEEHMVGHVRGQPATHIFLARP